MRYLKPYKLFENSHEEMMDVHFGVDVIIECDSIIADIKDMVLELSDIGLFTMVGYTPMTLTWVDKTPKIMVEVQGDLELCESNEDDINSTFERIKDYVRSKGYPTGFGSWEREDRNFAGRKRYKVYQMLIQK